LLNSIVALRLGETLTFIQREMDSRGITAYLGAGVVLTGGCSLIGGLVGFTEDLFGLPVKIGRAHPANAPANLGNPALTAPIGVARVGQMLSAELSGGGALDVLKTIFWNILGRK